MGANLGGTAKPQRFRLSLFHMNVQHVLCAYMCNVHHNYRFLPNKFICRIRKITTPTSLHLTDSYDSDTIKLSEN